MKPTFRLKYWLQIEHETQQLCGVKTNPFQLVSDLITITN